MSVHQLIVGALLAVAVLLAFVCSIGVLAMRDPYQRLHYIAPPTTISAFFITLAVWLDEPQKQAGMKMVLTTLILVAMNGVVTHATARAFRVRSRGDWRAAQDEKVTFVSERHDSGK